MGLVFEQQDRESDKAFAAFKTYLDMGPQRSLARVGRNLSKSKQLMERWSRRHRWVERTAAYERHMAEVERTSQEAMVTAKAPEWARRREQHKEAEWQLRSELIQAARKVLERFRDGSRGATLGDVARALDIASRLGRLSSGLPSDVSEVKETHQASLRMEWEVALRKVYGPEVAAAPANAEGRLESAEVVDV